MKNNRPAFPIQGVEELTKREYIAISVLQGLLANYSSNQDLTISTKQAVKYADALLEELNK